MDRVAVVTGGAGAIGGAIVDRLRADGCRTVVLDRDQADLGDAGAVRTAASLVLAEHGRVDVLVHAAAAFDAVSLDAADLAVWRHVQAINVEAALLLTQAFAPGMRERRFGRVVFVVSDTVWAPPRPDMLAYVTSKAALIGLARALAVDLSPDCVAVTCVAPGLTRTSASETGIPAAVFDDVVARQALRRPLTPADVADTVAFLASDAGAALTGQTLCVDGGLVMR